MSFSNYQATSDHKARVEQHDEEKDILMNTYNYEYF